MCWNPYRLMRAGALASFVAVILLAVQFIIAIPFAAELGILERSIAPNALATFLQAHARQLRWLMAADDAFVIAYTTTFTGIAALLWTRSRLLAAVGLGFALLTSVSDLIENSLTLALLTLATNSRTPEVAPLIILSIVTQLKWLWILIAATLFAIAIWDLRSPDRVVAVLFLIFPALGILAIVSPLVAIFRVLWMFVLLIAAGVLLWRSSAPSVTNALSG